ncbi:MAG TPA: response regulator transcription factor [Ktedonobacterales bacterium]|jgi:two-component system alkaline phosphatase synthesis response regulator PhoP|nr:response regulator transcription factor [Ktedonobacterales bacterium]
MGDASGRAAPSWLEILTVEQRPILVVEDDDALRETLAYNLGSEGYETLLAADGVVALELVRRQPVALVILDVMLPRLDGLDVLRQLRGRPETAGTPVLMLTARAEESDIVVGLELGADDYVTKPFSWNEVRARVRALLRRGGQRAEDPGAEPPENEPIIMGDLRIDEDRREVHKGERVIELPARLFELLLYLARHRGVVLTRGRLLENVWGYDYAGDTRTVDVHVRWLREKIEEDPANPQLVQTVRGVGYRFKG